MGPCLLLECETSDDTSRRGLGKCACKYFFCLRPCQVFLCFMGARCYSSILGLVDCLENENNRRCSIVATFHEKCAVAA